MNSVIAHIDIETGLSRFIRKYEGIGIDEGRYSARIDDILLFSMQTSTDQLIFGGYDLT